MPREAELTGIKQQACMAQHHVSALQPAGTNRWWAALRSTGIYYDSSSTSSSSSSCGTPWQRVRFDILHPSFLLQARVRRTGQHVNNSRAGLTAVDHVPPADVGADSGARPVHKVGGATVKDAFAVRPDWVSLRPLPLQDQRWAARTPLHVPWRVSCSATACALAQQLEACSVW